MESGQQSSAQGTRPIQLACFGKSSWGSQPNKRQSCFWFHAHSWLHFLSKEKDCIIKIFLFKKFFALLILNYVDNIIPDIAPEFFFPHALSSNPLREPRHRFCTLLKANAKFLSVNKMPPMILCGSRKRRGTWAWEQHCGVHGNSLQISEAQPRSWWMRWRIEEDAGNCEEWDGGLETA